MVLHSFAAVPVVAAAGKWWIQQQQAHLQQADCIHLAIQVEEQHIACSRGSSRGSSISK
jgi:hypothetical protein